MREDTASSSNHEKEDASEPERFGLLDITEEEIYELVRKYPYVLSALDD